MQRECNVVAFGELTLSTRLNINMKMIHPKSEIEDVIKACNSWTCRCWWSPQQEGIAFTTVLQQIARVFTNQYVDSSNLNLTLETLNSTRIVKCVKPVKDRKHHCKTASGETGRWWRQIEGHWSWHGARRLRKGPRGHCRTTMMMTLAKSTGLS